MLPDNLRTKDIKPELCGYIREAQLMLDPANVPDEKVIHDVRVLMKKCRASIKLLKTQMNEESFNREYFTYREVGRIMRSWRETSVHRKILKDLKKRFPDLFLHLKDNEKINQLLGRPEVVNILSQEMKEALEEITGSLHKSSYRLRFSNMGNIDPKLILGELEKSYDTVSLCFLKARNYPKDVNIHEFRKKTKDFLYQLTFFSSLKQRVIKDLEKRLDALGQNLGKFNDHAVLIKSLGYKFPSEEINSAVDELIVIIKQEQDRYLSKVWPSALRLFRPGKKLTDLIGLSTQIL